MKRLACLPLLVLAACPPPPQQPAAPVPTGAGCPAANDVYLATFLIPDEPAGGNGPAGPPPAAPPRAGGGGGASGLMAFAPSPAPISPYAGPTTAAPAPNSPTPSPVAPTPATPTPSTSPAAPSPAPASSNAGGAAGWALPLFNRQVDSFDGVPDYQELTADAAHALGVPAAPTNVWLIQPGVAPCKATVGPFYAMQVDAPTKNLSYGVKLLGCAPPPRENEDNDIAAAVSSEQPPSECQLLRPQPVAVRVGQEDQQGHWSRPTTQTALPSALTSVIPPHECKAPDCETLWAVLQVAVDKQPIAWAAAVNWLTIPANATPDTQCAWKDEVFEGLFVADSAGNATKLTDGQDPPLGLGGVLVDHGGPRILLTGSTGVYSTYDLVAGTAKLARHLVWLLLPSDEYTVDAHLGPACEDKH